MGIMVHIASYQHETNAITTHIRRQEEEKIEQIIVREKLEKSRKNLTSNPYHLLQKRTVSTTSCNSLHGEGDTVPGVRESITCTGHDILHTINQSQFVHRRRQHNRSWINETRTNRSAFSHSRFGTRWCPVVTEHALEPHKGNSQWMVGQPKARRAVGVIYKMIKEHKGNSQWVVGQPKARRAVGVIYKMIKEGQVRLYYDSVSFMNFCFIRWTCCCFS